MKELLGDKEIDVYSLARLQPGMDKEQIFTNLKTLKEEGLFREVGASELSASTLDIMQKVSRFTTSFNRQITYSPPRSSPFR